MYVTDVPVVDRMIDRPRWDTRIALDALDNALEDASGWLEELGCGIADEDHDGYDPATAHEMASDALSAVLTASQDVAEALARLGIEAL